MTVESLADYQLRLTFVDDSIYTVSLASEIERCQGLHPLKAPNEFNKACLIANEGWTVEWQDLDIQIGADTLWLDAQAQNATDDRAPASTMKTNTGQQFLSG